jgi:hypothetical protein
MKIAPFLVTLTLALAPAVFAQQPSATNPARLQLAPAAAPAAAPAPAAEPEVTLIPEQVVPKEKPVAPKPDTKSKTEQSAEDAAERIHFREARIKAERDPKVQAEWDRANKAKTDLEKREALKSYYTLLYARILKIDSSVKKTADLRSAASLHRLEQTRIDPTEPLDPQERAERFERSTGQ